MHRAAIVLMVSLAAYLMCECAARSACGGWLRRDAPLPVSVMGWTEVPNGAERCRHAHSAQPTVCPRAIAHRASAVALRVAQRAPHRAAPMSCNSASERQSRLPVPLFISHCVRALAALSRSLWHLILDIQYILEVKTRQDT